MNYLLITYSFVITLLLVMVWLDYSKLYRRYVDEQVHSEELRRTILKYLRGNKWKARYEEANHHLDLMVECYGIEALVELVEDENAK